MVEKNETYKPGRRASDVMVKPLPQILDEMDTAKEQALAAAAEARQAGQDAVDAVKTAAEKAVKGVAKDLEEYKQTTGQSLEGINATIKFIKGIIRTAGNVFTGIDKD